jgi:hypothetical protein
LGSNEKISAPEGTIEEVKVGGQPKQPALAASQDTIDKSLAILNLGSDGKIRDDLRNDLITGLKDSLVSDKKLQEALVKDFGTQANNKREIQIAVDILDLGIPFSINQLSLSGNSNQSLRKHLSSSSEKKVQPTDLWSKISDQSLKIVLEYANTVINTELKKQDGSITEDLNLFKREINSLEDKINSANKGQVANSKKLLTLAGNAVKLVGLGLVAGAGLELTGITDLMPGVGPGKGVTPPPEKVITNDVMKAITSFTGKDISSASQDTIQSRIDTNLNIAKAGDASLTLTPSAYYGNTLEPLSINGKNQGSKVQANIKLNPNEEDKPFLLIYQEGKTSVQITAVPLDAAKAEHLKQPPNSEVIVITLPAGGKPTIKTEEADLTPLL